MSVQYLKKTKMYKLLSSLIEAEYLPKASACEYKFYRGSEWLDVCVDYDYVIKFYHRGVGITLEIDKVDEEGRRHSVDRLTFAYLDDELILNYWRNGKNQFIKSCISKTA